MAAILARDRFGMAMAAMIKIIATTTNNSMSEKPFCLLHMMNSLSRLHRYRESIVNQLRLPCNEPIVLKLSSNRRRSDLVRE